MARNPTDTVKLQLRFHEALRRRLAREAKKHDRSLNAEIVHRLEQSLDVPEQAAALANEVRSAVKSAFFEWRSTEFKLPKSTRIGSTEFELPKGTRIGSVPTAEDDGEKK
jgi:Arc-like DNA binding domain